MRGFLPYVKYLKSVKWALIGAIVCGLLYGAANGAGLPYMAKTVFPKIFSETAVPLTVWQIVGIALWLPMIFLARGLAGYFNAYLTQYVGVRVLEALRLDYFRKLQQLPLAFFHRNSSGDLITRGLNDTAMLQSIITVTANELVKQPATLVGAIGYLVYLALTESGVTLILLTLSVIPICVLPIRFVGRKIIEKAQMLQSQAGSITDRFTENLSAIKEVRVFCLEDAEIRRFATLSAAMVRAQMKVAKYAQSLSPTIEFISAIGISITFLYAYQVKIGLGSFLSIIFALYVSYEPIKKLGTIHNDLKRGSVSLQRLEEVINAPNEIADPERPVEVKDLAGDIEFRDVGFSYESGAPALRDVVAHIPAGTVCALVGPSGAGKTTFAHLVPRLFDVTSGALTIDGIDVRAMRLGDLRSNIAVVSQDPVLFNDTIYDNLLYGRHDANRAEVEQAARDAFAHDFIMTLSAGYDTIVGERGAKLSGGQRQRIALARAFLRQAPILILDEATSALDSESEMFIQRALRKLMVGKTVLIIAHRFSTIRDASLILVFQNARIVAQGSHRALYESNVLYKTLYDQQQKAA